MSKSDFRSSQTVSPKSFFIKDSISIDFPLLKELTNPNACVDVGPTHNTLVSGPKKSITDLPTTEVFPLPASPVMITVLLALYKLLPDLSKAYFIISL
nr:MAG TPA: hypothetical protein [Crassvirales sp.]